MGFTRRQNITAGLAALQFVGLAGFGVHQLALMPSSHGHPEFETQRLPELDDRVMGGWLGNNQVVTGIPGDPLTPIFGFEWSKADVFDLQTHTYRSLPHLPVLGSEQESRRSNPYPSPDGKWLLYTESRYTKDKIIFNRLRLVHPDGSGTQLIPFPTHTDALRPHWLVDSSGWVGIGYGDLKRVAYRFHLNALIAPPARLALTEHGSLAAITNQLELIFDEGRSFRHTAVPLNAPTMRPRELDIRQGTLDAFWPGHHGGPWPIAFSRDGSFLIVHGSSSVPEKRIATWFPSFIEGSKTGLWRISLPGGAPELLPVPSDVGQFSLSPDGKKILYWRDSDAAGSQAYLLTLPKREQ